MSRKKTQLDEFAAMAKLYEILKPFDFEARQRMRQTVEEKIQAEAPKKRVRKGKQPDVAGVIGIEIPRLAN